MSQHKMERFIFLYNHVTFSPTTETKFLVLCKIYIHCFLSAIVEKFLGFQYGTYITCGLYCLHQTEKQQNKIRYQIFLYFKIIDLHEI